MSLFDLNECEIVFGSFEELDRCLPKRIFERRTILFLIELSNQVMKDKRAKNYPDLITFAFWCRATNLESMNARYGLNSTRLGIGTVLHITPKNVPINFAFSWVFSLLAGNKNFVKLPSTKFEQIDLFIEILIQMSKVEEYKDIASASLFFRTSHDSNIIEALSMATEGRVIWGSEETVRLIRNFPTPLRHSELIFPSRYSISVLSINNFLSLTDDEKEVVASKFTKDSLTFGQRGCSSPRKVFWIGDIHGLEDARLKFWQYANSFAEKIFGKGDSYTRLSNLASEAIINEVFQIEAGLIQSPLIHFLSDYELIDGVERVLSLGTFQEFQIDSLADLMPKIDENVQTVTYFGIEVSELLSEITEQGFKGVDRIVPFGAAFDMTPVWDGIDTIERLSRVIETR
jgi:hypothetical protein